MKITKYIVMLAAAVGMTAACQKEEFVTFNPEDVVAPVLHAVEDIVVTVDNKSEAVTFTWDAADFGVKTQVYYSLDMAKGGKTVNLFSGVSGTSMNVSLDNINNKAFNDLEIPSGEAGDVTFTLGAKLNVGETYYAAPVAAKVTPTAAEKVYPNVWVIGNYCGWAHDASLYLWNFAEDGDVFMGVVDFGAGDEKTGGFKITPEGNWNAEFGGTGTADVDPASIPVVTSGGSDIKNFTTMRFYHFSLSTTALTLSKNYAFNQVGIIGLNGDWENDIVMEYSKNKQRFYADIDVAAATEMKFRMDADWAVNFGGDIKALSNGGDNIPVEPGQYRVYLDMNNLGAITCTFDERMYGKEEEVGGSEPENPDTPVVENKGWGIVGTINEWGGAGADVDMKVGAGWLVAAGVELPEGSEIKFRLDGGWDVNFGGTFAADTEIALVAGGDNFKPAAGTYDIYLNPDIPAAYFMTAGAEAPATPQTWGIVGTTNNWGGDDLDMGMKLDEEGKYWVRKGVALPDGGEIKFRFAHDWGVNFGGTFAVDAVIELADGGDNLKTVAGTYDIYLDVEGAKAFIMTEGKTPADAGEAVVTYIDASDINVGFSGSAIGWDDPSFDTNDRASFVSKEVTDEATFAGTYTYELAALTVAENDEFKIRINGDWIGATGATVEGLAVTGEDNFVAGEAGTYKVTITFAWDGLKPSDVKAVFAK
ncbi:MAG: SusE domain-containing protein [Bacteroidales bacterium]|nr:SusE domain-containing protein [Bacteroidales bacterium]